MLKQLSVPAVLIMLGLGGCATPGGQDRGGQDGGGQESGAQPILCPAEGCAAPSQKTADTKALLKIASDIAAGRGFRRERVTYSGRLESGGFQAFPVLLNANDSYLAVGLCEGACRDLDLILFDEKGREIASDTLEDNIPIIEFGPGLSGSYILRTKMIRCDMEPCQFGVGVYRE